MRSAAIDACRIEIIDALETLADDFFSYLRENGVITLSEQQNLDRGTNRGKLLNLVGREGVLKFKDGGWLALNKYLSDHGRSALAEKLKQTAGESIGQPGLANVGTTNSTNPLTLVGQPIVNEPPVAATISALQSPVRSALRSKRQVLENNKMKLLAAIDHYDDIFSIADFLNLDSSRQHTLRNTSGVHQKQLIFDHLIRRIEERDYWIKLLTFLRSNGQDTIADKLETDLVSN